MNKNKIMISKHDSELIQCAIFINMVIGALVCIIAIGVSDSFIPPMSECQYMYSIEYLKRYNYKNNNTQNIDCYPHKDGFMPVLMGLSVILTVIFIIAFGFLYTMAIFDGIFKKLIPNFVAYDGDCYKSHY